VRILLVSRGFPPLLRWGSEYYTHELAAGLRARGHEIFVLHPMHDGSRPPDTVEEVASDGFRVFQLHVRGARHKPLSDSYSNERVERVFDGLMGVLRPDLVHFMYLLWGLSARLPVLCRQHGIPAVLTLTDLGLLCHRGQMFDWRMRACGGPHPAELCARCIREPAPYDGPAAGLFAKRWAARALAAAGGLGMVATRAAVLRRESAIRAGLQCIDHVLAPTAVVERMFLASGVPRERLSRLVYAFDGEKLAAARHEPRGDRVRLGYLGQFAPHKGLHVLLDAVRIMERRLPESVEPWELLCYGDSPHGRHARYPAAVQRRASPRAIVCAAFDAVSLTQVLAELHTVVVPSLWIENAPLTVLQARAAGIPVVASDVEGIREIVEPGVHGLLVPPGDAGALADALREIVLRRWPRRATFDLPMGFAEHLDAIEAIYGRLVAEATRRAPALALP
jgi:glycosyltransferase involved in cell wall biosynthesis